MPLVAYALASYIAGLYAGFSHSFWVGVVAVGAALVVGLTRARVIAAAYVALAIAGFAIAHRTSSDEQRCVADAATRSALVLSISDSVGPGGFTHGRLAGCDASVSLSVAGGSAREGTTIDARGTVLRSDHGLLMQHATIVERSRPPLLAGIRASAGRAIDETFGDDAPLVRALLIADRSDLSPEVRDRFAAAGLAHILAIAGLHIGFIALALTIAFELAGISRRRASIATIVVVVFYVAVIGAPVPAVRSATMLTVLLLTRLAQRPTSRWAIVALGAGHAVIDPRVVLDVGYQLSVVGVSAMIAAGLLGKRIGVERLPVVPRWIAATLLGTTVATIASAPIVAWSFGRVSLIAPLSNLAATPLIALAQPMIFFGMLLAPVHGVARFIADAAHPLLSGLTAVAAYSASLSAASIGVAPSAATALVGCIVSGATIVACASREWERPAFTALGAAALLAWLPATPVAQGMLELHMIDVGQGDAIALRTPHGHWILFDAGGAWRGGDAGKSTVVPYVGHRGGPADLFVLSHPHTDHVGGASAVLRVLRPPTYIDAGFPGAADAYRQSLETARDLHVRWTRAHPGDVLNVDGVTLRILAPDSTWTSRLDDPNLASVVVVAQFGDVRMLFMGDAERPEEEWLLEHARDELHADILKVGHHGSKTSSSDLFLDAVRPRAALVSVGAGNVYHLPTPAIMERLAAHGAQVLRTDRLGTIVARTDGARIWLDAGGDSWELSRELPER